MTSRFNFKKPVLILDLELTGLDPSIHQIIEIGAILCDQRSLEPFSSFSTFVGLDSSKRIELANPVSMKLNNINLERLSAAPDPVEAVHRLQTWVNQKTSRSFVLAGHGISTDYMFLSQVVENSSAPRLWKFPFDYIDTKSLARLYFAHFSHAKAPPEDKLTGLAKLAKTLGLPCNNHHSALADAETARKVLKFFLGTFDIPK